MKIRSIVLLSLLVVAIVITGYTMIHFSSQNNPRYAIPPEDYEKEWKKADSLKEQGLPQSALEVVDRIYASAKAAHNSPQLIKAVIYQMSLRSTFEEEYMEEILQDVGQEILQAEFPEKNILYSLQAELLWQYYQENRYEILDRTETEDFDPKDIRTWDLRKYVNEVITSYRISLEKSDELQKITLSGYDAILVVRDNSKKYRPTLYDFLAHRAVDYFMNQEPGLTEPVYKFEINSPGFFANSGDFARIDITTRDTFSLKYYAITLLQDLITFHLRDESPEALIDADLKRLGFVRDQAVVDLKDSLYRQSLQSLLDKYSQSPSSSEVSFLLATAWYEKGLNYDPLVSEQHKWDIKKAYDICQAALQKFPEAEGSRSCKSLFEKIQEKSLNLTTEYVNTGETPFPALLEYTNSSRVFIRIIRMDPEEDNKLREKSRDKTVLAKYLQYPALKQWELTLPDDGDFQHHATEIALPALLLGYYIVLVSPNADFSFKTDPVAWSSLWISNISFIDRRADDGRYDFYVLDRDNGTPLAGVRIETFYRDYNYDSREYRYKSWQQFVTDANGYFQVPAMPKNSDSRSFMIKFRYGQDQLFTENYFYHYSWDEKPPKVVTKTFFFTDRAIYRPGQTVYFKGIAIESEGKSNRILPGHKTKVTFYDVNYEKVSELDLVANEFGSFNGTFIAPAGTLTGTMTIRNESGSVQVQVEEYKRPKFEVVFQPVEGVYRLGEEVTVTGTASSYSGAGLDQAEVRYRIVRQASFPYPVWWWRGWFPDSPEMEIASGVITTGDTGQFAVTFKAIPDLSLEKKTKPVFRYTVYADVTDINGETQSSETTVSVGYTAMLMDLDIPGQIDQTGKPAYTLRTTNLNGQPEPVEVDVTIGRLTEPGRLFRERNWKRPDKFIMTREEFYKLFPNDIFDKEDDRETWSVQKTVLQKKYNTGTDTVIGFENMSEWEPGWYRVHLRATDAFGEEIEVKKHVIVFAPSGKKPPAEEMSWFAVLKGKGEPGETARFLYGTGEKNVQVIYEVIHEGKTIHREWIKLSDQQRLIEVPIIEDYRGNFEVNLAFIRHNRSYQDHHLVNVPYTNKQLDITFETFRNKLLPGQDEEWRIRIKDKKGEKVAAAMVATLYDASLDAFLPHSWDFDILKPYYGSNGWDISHAFSTRTSNIFSDRPSVNLSPLYRDYDALNWFGFEFYGWYGGRIMGVQALVMTKSDMTAEDNIVVADMAEEKIPESAKGEEPPSPETPPAEGQTGGIQIRKDFSETAFFLPELRTDEEGSVIIRFTMPESLTRWKMLGFAHTKELQNGMVTNELVTQKDLMVVPNPPRFFREGDTMAFAVKITNLSGQPLSGMATIEFFDAITMDPLEILMPGVRKEVPFTAGNSTVVSWPVNIPYEGVQAITYRVTARSGDFSDGEEMTLPVLTNRMLVTETLPLPVKGKQTKQFTFTKLVESGTSTTVKNHNLTLEYTSNPAWYAVQALPYLMEYPYECSEQVFSRYYANTLASHIANSNPKIKRVFDAWKNYTPDALLSNLEKNQELKALILEETPWVLNAQSESERKQRIALLFDLNRMADEQQSALKKLGEMQLPNGGWPWFKGMRDSRYITQHIVAGLGHLNHLQVKDVVSDDRVWDMTREAVSYLDDRIREDYEEIKKNYPDKMNENHIGYTQIHYLYARSYFTEFNFTIEIEPENQQAIDYFKGQASTYWLKQSLYMQGMIALALNRFGDEVTPPRIIKSLKEKAINKEELGMYWRQEAGYYWYEAPIETQALLIEAFDEVANDQKSVDEMKVWLLKHKQTQDWGTTKATVEAVYALLLRGTDFLASEELVSVQIGSQVVDPMKLDDVKVEAGTGYFKTSWHGKEITPDMGNITVTKTDDGVAWGAVYWQYFEDLDKITPHETPLKLEKKLFVERNTPTGPVIEPVNGNTLLKVGDRVKVRIELRVDRDMEYVHLKDMRAAAFEPVNVLSGYRYQGGLGYYESTRDAATNFFIGYLPKGTYVFEYPLKVSQKGNFSNGITTIQCMYAPEFAAHSEGVRVKVSD